MQVLHTTTEYGAIRLPALFELPGVGGQLPSYCKDLHQFTFSTAPRELV